MAVTESRYLPAAATGWWKGAALVIAVLVAAGVTAYAILLVHLMALTLLTMHTDIADMRGQLHRTTSALAVTNAKLEVVNTHLIATNRELLQTNHKLQQTNGKLSGTAAGVRAMKSDTARMTGQLNGMQRGIRAMLGDIHQMTHRIVHAKLLF